MNIFKIAFSNIKKNKGSAIALLIMMIISGLMLSVSLNLIMGLSNFYENKVKQLNAPHFSVFISDKSYTAEVENLVKNYEGIEITETEDCYFANANIYVKNQKQPYISYAVDMNTQRVIAPLEIIDKLSVLPDNPVVLPLTMKYTGKRAGDELRLEINNNDYYFTIYGFFEDTQWGSSLTNIAKIYFDTDSVSSFSGNQDFGKMNLLSIRFNNAKMSTEFYKQFQKLAVGGVSDIISTTFDSAKETATSFVSLIGIIVMLFSIIIFMVALIIVRFNIINNIDEGIKNFGALKSVGYTSKQITRSIVFQYLFIALIAVITGAVLSAIASPILGNVISSSSGLLWLKGVNFLSLLVMAVVILGITTLISYLVGGKSKKITPVNALRSGASANSFNKSRLEISKNKMPLQLNLGFKYLLNNIKNNITIFLAVGIFTFASILSVVMQYNFVTHSDIAFDMTGFDQRIVWVMFDEEIEQIQLDEIKSDSRVAYITFYDNMDMSCDDISLTFEIMDDFSEKENNAVYKGRYPIADNEIAIGGTTAKMLGKNINDLVTVTSGGKESEYLITGLAQSLANGGFMGALTTSGMKHLDELYVNKSISIKIKDGIDIADYTNELTEKLSDKAIVMNMHESIAKQIDSIASTISLVCMIIIIITILIITLILFLLISTLIRKNKKNIGIMKAIGYSNFQIIRQMVYTFLPIVIIASIAGLLLGFFATNPLMTVLLGSMGIMKASFVIPSALSFIAAILMIVLSAAVTVTVSLRVRKISAIKLIIE